MRALAVVGPDDADRTAAVADVVDALEDRGRVATVHHRDGEPDDAPASRDATAAPRSVTLAADGVWTASGEGRTLDDVLDDLAPEFDYVVVQGFENTDLPTVALGSHDADDPAVTAADADALATDAVLAAVADAPERETLNSLVADVEAHADSEYAGAVATFTGRVRERDNPEDVPTEHLEFERYDTVAEQRMATIREELCARDGVYDVRMHHRTGVVPAGEDVVFVVVLAGHRDEAFETVSDGIDRLKDEVPLFKKEVTVDEAFWRHERPQ
ncbi:molybdopterin synthase [Halobacterium jilantaiense]|uniref:Molybdopterin synthase subunit MoaE /molybdopterin guanine dinucleotide biosynthesis accessory protein MobB n=1 Tax=Halobacterium jilantaiense TaxID=355548 RepID=A0A1I0PA81_9EURY|nr:molybdopterin synthase [Halobacterium jilantaiense]SEW11046.1 molybdopterin synthase subunit MoaE /molybdopterin guanine dinucleotide biosynthesis accessory protein MobB [Halobacterium jilantaiense]